MNDIVEIAGPARMKLRHHRILNSFLLVVVAPMLLSAVYLWGFAKDQYISSMSFSVRTESLQSATDLLGGLSSITGSSSSDVDILTQYIASGDMVRLIESETDLVSVFSEEWPADFLFAYNPSGQFEDMLDYWNSNVLTHTENGIVTLSVRSYDAQASNRITLAIYEANRQLINRLSEEAHEDATRFSRDELEAAEDRLAAAREAMTGFRLQAQIVDPNATLEAQMRILTELQVQQAETFIQRDLLTRTAGTDDPRVHEVTRKIEALQAQIDIEKNKFGHGGQGQGQGQGGGDYATLFATYERLASDMLFAEEAYRSAQLAYNAALADAKRKARYLVAHVKPTVAEKSLYPKRLIQLFIVVLFVTLLWSVGLLIYYSIRDRR
ncbi:capsule polysaccharide export inner-membrane protein [Litoreibacter arenae]|uniref:Capsule polysaccharide export inner-membrane protein n=1 Tax=Litoreibacter arenae DSM 19593 TaxID=1123360 RepID=S9QG39_9RHOB|nr:capsule polysaccharide export inner-membrane protein [Litoreibacter arenae]EPX78543.1 Capsule polysaccharide export inner-membrane protein [Litoreibacter arenae DSM 19593]